MASERYPPDYRQAELKLIYQLILQRKSVAMVGLAGVGKSNLVRYLRDGLQAPHYLGNAAGQILFAEVNAVRWDGKPVTLWQIMGGSLLRASEHITPPVDPGSISHLSEEQHFFDWLKAQLKLVCLKHGYQVVFILDNFDQVLSTGPLPMIDSLSEIRTSGDAGSVGSVSYVMFTQRLPHLLIGKHRQGEESSFCKLIRTHTYALGLYDDKDARQMVEYLNHGSVNPLSHEQIDIVLELAGGHAGLISAIFDNWPPHSEPQPEPVSYFAQQADVQGECRRVLQSLHSWEQETAVALAQGSTPAPRWDFVELLVTRGVLHDTHPIKWFSPLWQRFLQSQPQIRKM
jgi:hypothetical protein